MKQKGRSDRLGVLTGYLVLVKAKDAEVFDTHQVLKQEDGL
jgi:hypothetical protein